jgi:hypothetical protein
MAKVFIDGGRVAVEPELPLDHRRSRRRRIARREREQLGNREVEAVETFIVECIIESEDEAGLKLDRKMVGPFFTFEAAHAWMMSPEVVPLYDSCLIHSIQKREKLT